MFLDNELKVGIDQFKGGKGFKLDENLLETDDFVLTPMDRGDEATVTKNTIDLAKLDSYDIELEKE